MAQRLIGRWNKLFLLWLKQSEEFRFFPNFFIARPLELHLHSPQSENKIVRFYMIFQEMFAECEWCYAQFLGLSRAQASVLFERFTFFTRNAFSPCFAMHQAHTRKNNRRIAASFFLSVAMQEYEETKVKYRFSIQMKEYIKIVWRVNWRTWTRD